MNEGTAAARSTVRILGLNAWLVYLFLYAPIALLIFFSFNDNDNVAIWTQPSLRWYGEMFQDESVMGALR
ncbi:MAG: putrescine ABC transporter permease PotI, partial [Acidimicrobiia bacterium]